MKHTKQQWQAMFDDQQQSGLSIAAFCHAKNVNRKYFYYHRSQYLKSLNSSAFVQAKPPQVNLRVIGGRLSCYAVLPYSGRIG